MSKQCATCTHFRHAQRILDPATGEQVVLGICNLTGANRFADGGCVLHAARIDPPAAP